MDISWALHQEVRWEQATGEYDSCAQPVRQDRGMIPARLVRKMRMVRDSDGKDVISNSQLHTLQEIGINDRITFQGEQYYPINTSGGLGLHDTEPSFYVTYL